MKDKLIVYSKPKSNISEDIRTIRTNLQFTSNNNKTILVTSSVPGEGKSFISSNLAVSFAQTGENVLLIDCDLRLGVQHELFKVSNKQGVSNLLASNKINKFKDYIQKTEIDGLSVITRGTVPPNPSELLGSNNMKELIELLSPLYDHIIFDGTPITGLPDSLIMAKVVDKVMIVCSMNYTNIDDLDSTKKALQKIDANIAGVVINKVEPRRRGKYSKYYYYGE